MIKLRGHKTTPANTHNPYGSLGKCVCFSAEMLHKERTLIVYLLFSLLNFAAVFPCFLDAVLPSYSNCFLLIITSIISVYFLPT